ncbi:hypothetical protein BGX31_001997 [Mortierella sp. GBA43]|nr:hypothetical protein BGX31_001997 [Mortierella sp. GBA43]
MSDSVDQLLSQALLEQLGPLINRVDKQLRDLAQVQVLLQGDIAEISGELESTQTELDRVHDTFARLPHYVAKVTAMKNTIASVTTLTKKLKRRASQVAVSREKQAVRAQVTKAKEQAYDQTIAAVQAAPSTPTRPSISRQASTSTIPSGIGTSQYSHPSKLHLDTRGCDKTSSNFKYILFHESSISVAYQTCDSCHICYTAIEQTWNTTLTFSRNITTTVWKTIK